MSVDPEELAEMVKACDRAATLRGSGDVGVAKSELSARALARRSIVLGMVGYRPVRRLSPRTWDSKGLGPGCPRLRHLRLSANSARNSLLRGTIVSWDDVY